MAAKSPLIAIVGPTAGGKTDLAIKLAKKYGGEIICADSRTVYKELDIGTAKPSSKQRLAIKHHLLDIVEPNEDFTVADFKNLATASIKNISERGKLPIMVGGSGLYIDAVLYDFQFASSEAPRNPKNPRHLSPEIETKRNKLRPSTLIIGLSIERAVLRDRIGSRVKHMVEQGLANEVRRAGEKYPNSKALLAPGYKSMARYIAGEISLAEAKTEFVRSDYQLARRQMTWFRRNHDIDWVKNYSEADKLIDNFLSKFDTIAS